MNWGVGRVAWFRGVNTQWMEFKVSQCFRGRGSRWLQAYKLGICPTLQLSTMVAAGSHGQDVFGEQENTVGVLSAGFCSLLVPTGAMSHP